MAKARKTAVKCGALLTRASLSVDEPRKCVLGYVRELPEVGSPMIRDVEREEKLVDQVVALLDELRGLRSRVHAQAFEQWSEEEIEAALSSAQNAGRPGPAGRTSGPRDSGTEAPCILE